MKKIFLITAASSEIGSSYIAQINKREKDAIVIAQYRNWNHLLEGVKNTCCDIRIVFFQCNLETAQDVSRLIEFIQKDYGNPTHILHLPAKLVNNKKLKSVKWSDISSEIEIQVHSVFEILKAFLPAMSKNGYGRVVFVLTAYILGKPPKYMTEYIVAKSALWGLMKSLASEYAGTGVTINGISPNMIETKFLNNLDPRQIEINALNCCQKRNVNMDEVHAGINYLFGESSGYINGCNLNMSGGDYM